jgi:hypothetical protein
MGPFALLPACDYSRFAQYLHVVRKPRLADVQLFQQYAGAFLPAAELFEYSQPPRIAEGLEHPGVLLVCIFRSAHLPSSFFDVFSIGVKSTFVNMLWTDIASKFLCAVRRKYDIIETFRKIY